MKRDKRNIRDRIREKLPCSEVLIQTYFFIEEMDRLEKTNLLDVFVNVYLVDEKMTMDELADRINYSLSSAAKAVMEVKDITDSIELSMREASDFKASEVQDGHKKIQDLLKLYFKRKRACSIFHPF